MDRADYLVLSLICLGAVMNAVHRAAEAAAEDNWFGVLVALIALLMAAYYGWKTLREALS